MDSVVLVLRFGHGCIRASFSHGFFVGDYRVGFDNLALSVILLQIVEADLNMELTAASDDVFSRFFELADDEWIRLGKFLKTFDQFGEISRVFGLNSDSHDWGDRVFHGSDRVSLVSRDIN